MTHGRALAAWYVPIALMALTAGGCDDSSSAAGGAVTTSTGGAGGAAGAGAMGGDAGSGGSSDCTSDDTRACYSGPAETRDVGQCTDGTQTCVDGSWGACVDDVLPVVETCATTTDDDCNGTDCVVWNIATNDGGARWGAALAVDTDDNIVVVGMFEGPLDFGAGATNSGGDNDIFVAKLDSMGAPLWTRGYGGTNNQGSFATSYAIATDASNRVVVAGTFSGTVDFGDGPVTAGGHDGFVLMLDAAGTPVWSRTFGREGVDQDIRGVMTDTAGNVYVTGSYIGPTDLGGGTWADHGAFVLKLDSAGEHVFSRELGTGTEGGNVAVDASGNLFITGRFADHVDFGTAQLGPAVGNSDGFVAKLDASGVHIWSKQLTGPGQDSARSLTTDSSGNVLVSGYFETELHIDAVTLTAFGGRTYLIKLDPAGDHLWSQHYDTQSHCELASDAEDNVLISTTLDAGSGGMPDFGGGPFQVPGPGINQVLVAKLDAAGHHQWSRAFANARSRDITTDSTSNVLITGLYIDMVDFGAGPLTSTLSNIFVAKLNP